MLIFLSFIKPRRGLFEYEIYSSSHYAKSLLIEILPNWTLLSLNRGLVREAQSTIKLHGNNIPINNKDQFLKKS